MTFAYLETTSLPRLFWRYVTPTVASMLITGIYVVVDGIFIGHILGEDGLAGITLAYPISSILYAVGALIGMGASALASLHMGNQETQTARHIVGNALWMSILAALTLGIAGIISGESLLRWMGATGAIFEAGKAYLFWYFLLGFFPIASLVFTTLLRNDGRPGMVTCILVAGGILNVILDWLFMVVFSWGLTGVAIATMLCQAMTGLLALGYFFTRHSHLRIRCDSLRPSLAMISRIFRSGIASFLMYLYLPVVLTLYNKALLWVGTPLHVAAYGILGYVEAIFYLIFQGIAFGIQPITSFNAGAKQWDRVFKIRTLALGTATILGVVAWLGMTLWAEEIVFLFTGNNPVLTPITVQAIRLYFWGLPMEGILLVGAIYFQSIGHSRTAAFFNGGKLAMTGNLLFSLGALFGISGVWLSLPLGNTLLAITLLAILWRESHAHNTPRSPAP